MSQALRKQRIEIEIPELHAGQKHIVSNASRFNVLACGRRFGKTTLGIELDVNPALDGFPVAWFSPTYKMMGDVWREVRKILVPITRRVAAQEHRLELITGGVIDMWSLDSPDSTRGRKYKRVVVDEAAMVPNFQEAWQAAIRPTLTDYKGDAYWLSTPKGMNFFKQGFDFGQDPLMDEWASWQMPTTANPYISKDEVEKARLELPELTFKQEYLAEFLQSEGAVFRNIDSNLIAPLNATPADHLGHKIMAGLDLAKRHDFTVLSVGCADCKVELAMERFNQIDYRVQISKLIRVLQYWGVDQVAIDATGVGDAVIEFLETELYAASQLGLSGVDQPSRDGLGTAL